MVSSGDNYLASAQFQASLDKGIPYYDAIAMDEIEYDAIAIGNHQFDFGPEIFANFVKSFDSRTPFVSSNLDFSESRSSIVWCGVTAVVSQRHRQRGREEIRLVGATTELCPPSPARGMSSPRTILRQCRPR